MRILGLSIIVGIVAGLAATVFYVATEAASHFALDGLAGYRPEPAPAGEIKFSWMQPTDTTFRPWMLVVIPTVGGLLAGLIIYTFAPEAEGHGTDSAIAAYHRKQGYMRPIVPDGEDHRQRADHRLGWFWRSRRPHRTDRRRLWFCAGRYAEAASCRAADPAGCRHGGRHRRNLSAPVAGALFASEVLYSSPEFEPEVLLPAALSSVIAYSTFGAIFGWTPLFDTPELAFGSPVQLVGYTLLALGDGSAGNALYADVLRHYGALSSNAGSASHSAGNWRVLDGPPGRGTLLLRSASKPCSACCRSVMGRSNKCLLNPIR